MDPRLPAIAQDPANTIFAVCSFGSDLSPGISQRDTNPRYRYNVHEVRGYLGAVPRPSPIF
jgi:hypothetical protein